MRNKVSERPILEVSRNRGTQVFNSGNNVKNVEIKRNPKIKKGGSERLPLPQW